MTDPTPTTAELRARQEWQETVTTAGRAYERSQHAIDAAYRQALAANTPFDQAKYWAANRAREQLTLAAMLKYHERFIAAGKAHDKALKECAL